MRQIGIEETYFDNARRSILDSNVYRVTREKSIYCIIYFSLEHRIYSQYFISFPSNYSFSLSRDNSIISQRLDRKMFYNDVWWYLMNRFPNIEFQKSMDTNRGKSSTYNLNWSRNGNLNGERSKEDNQQGRWLTSNWRIRILNDEVKESAANPRFSPSTESCSSFKRSRLINTKPGYLSLFPRHGIRISNFHPPQPRL